MESLTYNEKNESFSSKHSEDKDNQIPYTDEDPPAILSIQRVAQGTPEDIIPL